MGKYFYIFVVSILLVIWCSVPMVLIVLWALNTTHITICIIVGLLWVGLTSVFVYRENEKDGRKF